MPMSGSETPNKTPKQREVVPRPDGRGALMTGGTNAGGPGRPKSAIRRASQEGYDKLLDRLLAEADDPDCPLAARIKILELCGRFGLGDLKEVELQSADVLVALKAVLIESRKDYGIGSPEDAIKLYDAVVARLGDA